MALPANWVTVPVTGAFVGRDGRPVSGQVTFESAQTVEIGGVLVVPRMIAAKLDKAGRIPAGFRLPATNDPDLNIGGWAYKVTESWPSGRTYNIFVPHDAAVIDLPTVGPVVAPPDLVNTIPGARGPKGDDGADGAPGPTGDVTPAALVARDAAQSAATSAQADAVAAAGSAGVASGHATAAAASAALAEQARLLGATIGFATKADMDASLAHPEGTLALVTNDGTAANNVTYRKTGASGSGSWVQSADRVSGLEGRIGIVEGGDFADSALLGGHSDAVAIADGDGNVLIRVAEVPVEIDGAISVRASGDIDTDALATISRPDGYAFAFADEDGNIAMAVDDAGRLIANFDAAAGGGTFDVSGTYDYEVNHVFNYGQSLSVGQATPAISTVQKYDNLMFTGGMRPQYDYAAQTPSQWYASLVPAVEALSPANPALAETPSTATGDAIKERILAEAGIAHGAMAYQMLLSAPGYGAQSIAQLSKGSVHYARMVEQSSYGLALANASNKTYAVQAVTWTQGENDYFLNTSAGTYQAALGTLVSDLNADIKAVTGQTKSIPLISYQLASHKVYSRATPTIALALAGAAESNPLIYIATPMYHFDYAGPADAHLTAISSRWLGAYYGLAYKRIVIDGVDWKPLKPVSAIKQGRTAIVTFHVPRGPLVLDTSSVAMNTDYGFELVSSAGDPLAISGVSIAGPSTVRITAAATIPAGAKLRYAWTGSGTVGSSTGPRGNLRDSQGDSIIFDPQGINKPLHNWCIIFEMEI